MPARHRQTSVQKQSSTAILVIESTRALKEEWSSAMKLDTGCPPTSSANVLLTTGHYHDYTQWYAFRVCVACNWKIKMEQVVLRKTFPKKHKTCKYKLCVLPSSPLPHCRWMSVVRGHLKAFIFWRDLHRNFCSAYSMTCVNLLIGGFQRMELANFLLN